MNLVTIAWKSIRQRALASCLTALSVALGVTLMVSVLVVHGIVDRIFSQNASGYNIVVGAKGSPLQLVLNTIYHLGDPVENIPYLYYKELQANPRVQNAIPICMGDVSREGNFRIIGTSPEFFEVDYLPEKKFRVRGHFLEDDFDAVIGAQVARVNNWTVGSTFQPAHGVADDDHVHEEKFTVVGVLAPTGTPNDNGIYIHMDGFYQIAGHEKPADEAAAKAKAFIEFEKKEGRGAEKPAAATPAAPPKPAAPKHADHAGHDHAGHHHHALPDEQKEVTAILINFPPEREIAGIQLIASINEGPYAQAAIPFKEVNWIMKNVVGNVRTLLVILTALILVVSGVGIFVSIYNSMADRRREIAVMRALGAQRGTVFAIIFLESILLCVGGGLFGILLGHGMVVIAAPILEVRTGLLIDPWAFETLELILLPALIALASLVGIVPGMTAYRTDVAKSLQS